MKKLYLVQVVDKIIYRRVIEAHTKRDALRQAEKLWDKDPDKFAIWHNERAEFEVVSCMAQLGAGAEKLIDILQQGGSES